MWFLSSRHLSGLFGFRAQRITFLHRRIDPAYWRWLLNPIYTSRHPIYSKHKHRVSPSLPPGHVPTEDGYTSGRFQYLWTASACTFPTIRSSLRFTPVNDIMASIHQYPEFSSFSSRSFRIPSSRSPPRPLINEPTCVYYPPSPASGGWVNLTFLSSGSNTARNWATGPDIG
jgi:hypothetical protein